MTPKIPTNTPMSDSDLDNFIDSFWDELDKELEKLKEEGYIERVDLDEELEEATQDDQDDPSVWEQK